MTAPAAPTGATTATRATTPTAPATAAPTPGATAARAARVAGGATAPAGATALTAATPGSDTVTGEARSRARRDLTGLTLVLVSLGLLLLALVVRRALAGADALADDRLFWVAMVVVVGPPTWRVLTPRVSGRERVVAALALGVGVQLSRTVLYPTHFAFHDELVHGNLLRLVLQTQDAFPVNSVLPVTSAYPGLEIATAGVVAMTGLSPHTAAVLVLLLARVVMVLAVLGIVRALTRSTTAGCVAVVVYACNPQFVFFNGQYSYQTIALPIGLLLVYLLLTRGGGRARLLAPLAALVALAVSHHLTSMLFVAAVGVWGAVELVANGRAGRHGRTGDLEAATAARAAARTARRHAADLLAVAAVGVAVIVFLATRIDNPVRTYLDEIAALSANNIDALTQGRSNKQLFSDPAGVATPDWQRVLLIVALVLTTVAVLAGLWRLRHSLRRSRVPAVLLLAVSAIWPLVPAGHLTQATSEVTDRASGFVFVGVAFVVAASRLLGSGGDGARGRRATARRAGVFLLVMATFVGNTVLGIGPVWARLPGPFLVGADNRSVEAANLAAARWVGATQAPNSVLFGDRIGGLLGALYGRQTTLRHVQTNIDASVLLLQPGFTADDLALIRRAHIRWVVVDRRDATGLPHVGVYVENGEFAGADRTRPVSAAGLRKFDSVPGVARDYDNGSVVVYDVSALDPAQAGGAQVAPEESR